MPYFESHPANRDCAWCLETTTSALRSLASLVDILKQQIDINKNAHDKIKSCLHGMASSTFTIYGDACGYFEREKYADILIESGINGLGVIVEESKRRVTLPLSRTCFSDTWLIEKLGYIILDVACSLSELRREFGIIQGFQEDLESGLYEFLRQVMALYGYACDVQVKEKHLLILMKEGLRGYEKIVNAYEGRFFGISPLGDNVNILNTDSRDQEYQECVRILDKFTALLRESRGFGRPQLHALITAPPRMLKEQVIFKDIADMLEEVTEGRLEWETFVFVASDVLPVLTKAIALSSQDSETETLAW